MEVINQQRQLSSFDLKVEELIQQRSKSTTPSSMMKKKKPLPKTPVDKLNSQKSLPVIHSQDTTASRRNSTNMLFVNSDINEASDFPSPRPRSRTSLYRSSTNGFLKNDTEQLSKSPAMMASNIALDQNSQQYQQQQQQLHASQYHGSTDYYYSNANTHGEYNGSYCQQESSGYSYNNNNMYVYSQQQQVHHQQTHQQPYYYWNNNQQQPVPLSYNHQQEPAFENTYYNDNYNSAIYNNTNDPNLINNNENENNTATTPIESNCINGWKTSSRKTTEAAVKSDSLSSGTHSEKPHEPTAEEYEQETLTRQLSVILQRKLSKEQILVNTANLFRRLGISQEQEDAQSTIEGRDSSRSGAITPSTGSSSSVEESNEISTPHSSTSFLSYQQGLANTTPSVTLQHESPIKEEEDFRSSFLASEQYFQQSNISTAASIRISSPWGTSPSQKRQSRTFSVRNSASRASTGSMLNSMSIKTAQASDIASPRLSNVYTSSASNNAIRLEEFFHQNNLSSATDFNSNSEIAFATISSQYDQQQQEENYCKTPSFTISESNNKKSSLSIASCSLVDVRDNIKLYRRMATKTRNSNIQMEYANYLIQISKLYDTTTASSAQYYSKKPISTPKKYRKQQVETPSETRCRLLAEAGYWIERLSNKAHNPEALYIKGKWHLLGPDAKDCVLEGYEKINEQKAFKCFLRASKEGSIEANYELAHLWKKRGEYKKAIACYEKSAESNHTLSLYKLAKISLRGQLKQYKDIEKGMRYLEKAADINDAASAEPAFVLGCIYANEFERIGIRRRESLDASTEYSNPSLALKYLKQSAEHDYPDAAYFMGQIYETGILGQLGDSWQAYQNYMKAADADHAGAMLDLSRIYFEGIPGLLAAQRDLAFKWCKKSADQGFDQAEYVLGKYFEDGIGVTADFPRALEYYGRAASKGYLLALEELNRAVTTDNSSTDVETQPQQKRTQGVSARILLSTINSITKVKLDEDDDDIDEEKHYSVHQKQQINTCTIQ